MTQAQKTAKEKFKKAIEYRKKTGVSLKEAFAHVYGKKVGAVKKAPVKKSSPGKHVDTKSHTVNIRIVSGIKKKAKAKKSAVKKADGVAITIISAFLIVSIILLLRLNFAVSNSMDCKYLGLCLN
jgi:hypothetical protein